MSYANLKFTTNGSVNIEPSRDGKFKVEADNVEVYEILSGISTADLLSNINIDDVINELEEHYGYEIAIKD